jgi:hypothetical protein
MILWAESRPPVTLQPTMHVASVGWDLFPSLHSSWNTIEDQMLTMFAPQNILDELDRLLIREEHVSKMITRRDIRE